MSIGMLLSHPASSLLQASAVGTS